MGSRALVGGVLPALALSQVPILSVVELLLLSGGLGLGEVDEAIGLVLVEAGTDVVLDLGGNGDGDVVVVVGVDDVY